MRRFDVIGFDADDTLWKSEDGFRANELRFVDLVAPYAPAGVDVKAAMVECAIAITEGAVPTSVIGELVERARDQLQEPVRLLPDVPEVLADVGKHYRLVLITKGDLIHQTHKVDVSGLAHHFEHIEIVLEKDPPTYARLMERFEVEPERFCMVGNSVRSDILPVMSLGGHGVHVPYELLWELEHIDHDEQLTELTRLGELTGWLAEHDPGAFRT
jgi:putative hydrolase of the HAD superfamily